MQFYSIEELAGILKLHPKTILRFIHEGKIEARKVGRSWRVTREALEEYSHAEFATPPADGGTVDFASIPSRTRISAVIEIDEHGSEEASRLSNTLMAALNAGDPAWGNPRVDVFYYPEARKAKYTLYGTPKFMIDVMTMVDRLSCLEREGA